MSAQRLTPLSEFPCSSRYRISDAAELLTPALVLYPDCINSNIDCTLRLLNGDGDRWRVHVKTAKFAYTLRAFIERGVRNFKCATTLELLLACRSGVSDILLAYPVMGASARRAREIAAEFPPIKFSVLAENEAQLQQWRGSLFGIFLDVNSGMNRTGVQQTDVDQILRLVRAISEADLEFRGLHYYDGHLGHLHEPERTAVAHAGYDALLKIVAEIGAVGVPVPEVITSGTPSFPTSLTHAGLRVGHFLHRVSPGTVAYNDATSLAQLPADFGYSPAALVLARVVSKPRPGILTCDAGHKAVSADAGVPTCVILGHPELTPLSPSEEHLPLAVQEGTTGPQVGDLIFLLPRHVCPTVNNFDHALLVRDGQIVSVETVSARGHEAPLLHAVAGKAR